MATSQNSLPKDLYRPGQPFTAVELQMMAHEGVLRYVAGDVYADSSLPMGPSLRARAASGLLSPTLRRVAVFCGETAAWVHLGSRAPGNVMIITDGLYRRPTGSHGQWQIHQTTVDAGDELQIDETRLTTLERTAEDLFIGIGVSGSRHRMDLLPEVRTAVSRQLRFWPESTRHPNLDHRRIWSGKDQEQLAVNRRAELIRLVMKTAGLSPATLADRLMRRINKMRNDPQKREDIQLTLDQCVSRRLPTVRYTS